MAEIVNLRRVRKAKARIEAEAAASTNRARHGVSKPNRNLTKAQSEKDRGALEGRKLEADPDRKD